MKKRSRLACVSTFITYTWLLTRVVQVKKHPFVCSPTLRAFYITITKLFCLKIFALSQIREVLPTSSVANVRSEEKNLKNRRKKEERSEINVCEDFSYKVFKEILKNLCWLYKFCESGKRTKNLWKKNVNKDCVVLSYRSVKGWFFLWISHVVFPKNVTFVLDKGAHLT